MTVQTVKLGGKKFVIVPEKDYRRLQEKAEEIDPKPTPRRRRLTAQDRGDIAEAARRLNDPKEKPIPYQQVRKELGIA